MENSKSLILKAINDFVRCLYDVFPSKRQTPLGRYKRLIKHITPSDEAYFRLVQGFLNFFKVAGPNFGKVSRDMIIEYPINGKKKIAINIPIGICLSSPEKSVVAKHLFVIRGLLGMDPTEEEIKEKEGEEGQENREKRLIEELIKEIEGTTINVTAELPIQALQQILESGLFQKLISRLEDGVKSGDLDGERLMDEMKKFVPRLLQRYTSAGGDTSQITQLLPMLNSLIGIGK